MVRIKANEVAIAYVTYDSNHPNKGGKYRPIMVLEVDKSSILALRLTTKYTTKPPLIKKQYYKIKSWNKVGLEKKSWIDIGMVEKFPKKNLELKKIGYLATPDIVNLNKFINKYIVKNSFINVQDQLNASHKPTNTNDKYESSTHTPSSSHRHSARKKTKVKRSNR